MDIKLKLESNTFDGNMAQNGGAIYFGKKESDFYNENNEEIFIKNNNFTYNKAYSFGGAIYSEFDRLNISNSNDNVINYNSAGILGGGIFVSESTNKNLFHLNGFSFTNNTVESYSNDYTTKPSKIKLISNINDNVYSSGIIKLTFELYDEYNQILYDYANFYSSLLLKLNIKSPIEVEDDIDNNKNNNFLEGNICSFSKGIIYL